MNKNLEHLFHAVIIGVVLCLVMTQVMGQSTKVACDRSMVIAALAFVYMVMYGHKFPPGNVNPSFKW